MHIFIKFTNIFSIFECMRTKADIIAQLQKDILPLQGFKSILKNSALDTLLGPLANAFPNKSFPLGGMHEFIADGAEGTAVTTAFISVLLQSLINKKGVCIWIGSAGSIFPPAFKSFGVAAGQIIFIDLYKEKEILWAMEEALKCKGLSAVIAQLPELGFTASRRLQLAVEESRVTGFIIRQHPKNIQTTACLTRWKIKSLASVPDNGMPGVGFPRWQVELLKVRHGQPGKWQIECRGAQFYPIYKTVSLPLQKQKTG